MDALTAKLYEIRTVMMGVEHSLFCLRAELAGLQWDIEDALEATEH
jgi:hypothetical protein